MNQEEMSMQFTKPYMEDVGPQKIESIKFCTLSEKEILKISEVQVCYDNYYNDLGKPEANGLLDPHMGPPNKFVKCETCGGDFRNCPGHYGYINLALPVYNVGFLSTIVDIMKCICKKCSIVLLKENERLDFLKKMRGPKLDHLKKIEILKTIVKRCNSLGGTSVVCSRCGYINGMVKKKQMEIVHNHARVADNADCGLEEFQLAFSHINENVTLPLNLDPKRVYELLKNMRDEDCELLYLNDRPENLMFTSILVPPTSIRPSNRIGDGIHRYETDVSERLKYIIQANAGIRSEMAETGSQSNRCMVYWQNLQEEVARYLNNDVSWLEPEPADGSGRQLSGFVQCFKGKQGKFCFDLSRKCVEFTGRTVISPDPNLKITEVGIPILMARILTYPERVAHHNIEKLRQCIRNGPKKYPGAKILTLPDGYEISLMHSSRKHHADQLKYGYIVHRYLEDGDVVLVNRQPSLQRMSIMSHLARIMPGRTLRFNQSLCNPYNADFDGDQMNIHVPQTEEARTEALMLTGVLNNLCTPKNGEILVASTQDFLTSSFLITRKDTFYDRSDFSLMCSYIGDAMEPIDLPTPALCKPVELWTGKQLFSVLLRPHANMRVYLNLTVAEKSYGKSRETMCSKDGFVYIRNSELISGQLGKATLGNGNKDGIYSVLLRDYGPHAAATCMNRLAKLSARWIGNHGFSIGINDVQPEATLNKEKMVTVDNEYGYFTDAKGIVQNSFYTGLSVTDFFSHAMCGREGFVDTMVKTADTGYVSRRLMRALEDLSICHDNTVRNASACIVQFAYGVDSMDPAQLEDKSGFPLNFERLFLKAKATCPAKEQKSLTIDEIEKIVENIIERRLVKSSMTPEDECLAGFAESIRNFIKQKGPSSICKKLKLSEGRHSEEDRCYLENIAYNISGITQRQLMDFLETCISRYNSKKIEAGTPIGAIGAQSIGVASMKWVPRMKEIVDGSEKIKKSIITTHLEVNNNDITAKMVKARIEITLLKQVAQIITASKSLKSASIVVTLDMDRIKEAHLHIDAHSVKKSILQSVPKLKLKEQQIRVLDKQKLEVTLAGDKSELQYELHELKSKLSKVVVKGIRSIYCSTIHDESEEKDPDVCKKLTLLVEGNGLLSVMGTEGVNFQTTVSNNIMEVQQVLGIEAARKKIIDEINYNMSSHGMTIDTRHVMLLADLMSFQGVVLGMNRFGMERMRDSVLMHASFEKTADHLFNASVNGRVDKIEGVSECIIMGIPMQVGTGMLEVKQSVPSVELTYAPDPII